MTKEEVIFTAVQWWSDKLASRARHDNGDNSQASMLACLFADMSTQSITKDQLSIFEKVLSERVLETYDEQLEKHKFPSCVIGCDYGPCSELYSAAEAAGISTLNFPFKTWMRITPDHVEVADGYAQPYVRI